VELGRKYVASPSSLSFGGSGRSLSQALSGLCFDDWEIQIKQKFI